MRIEIGDGGPASEARDGERPQRRITVKICGLTNPDDAAAAVAAGADFLGFVFFPDSRRCLPDTACGWISGIRGASKVGVFRDQAAEAVRRLREAAGLDLVQLHGGEPPAMCAELGGKGRVIKAISVGGVIDWEAVSAYDRVARVLFDTASPMGGGTGRSFDWGLLERGPQGLGFWLAGGLTPEKVAEAVRASRPAGVDVASGVESAVGVKDPDKIRAFIAAVHGVERG